MIKVFYDDRCLLCLREIEYYKKISPPAIINWCGINQNISLLEKHGISYIESLKMLHAINAEGKIYCGIDSFIIIWQQLAGWKWLARLIKLPVIYQVSKYLYRVFAIWRFNRLTYCEIV
jgi:predicted DCC family thiol-disulfide oxidoreductase YuxK